jgi:hypothetical protein
MPTYEFLMFDQADREKKNIQEFFDRASELFPG